MNASPKVTVYVPCRSYGRFLGEALASVERQSLDLWELIVFTEGSADETPHIARSFLAKFSKKTRLVETTEPLGLRECANRALEMARGQYILRLDADDYLDESALLVLSTYLDNHPDAALVYPNWTYITENGEVIGVERRKRIESEVDLLDLPAHGACTLIRKRVLKAVGGYDTRFDTQDGHEVWLRALHRFRIANVETPLFFYRQHDSSLSRDTDALLASRRAIKRVVASRYDGKVRPRSLALIPVKNTYEGLPNVALAPFADKPLIDYTLDCARDSGAFDLVYISTDDASVVAHCEHREGVIARLRDPRLSDPVVHMSEILRAALEDIEGNLDFYADLVAILNVHAPLRRPEHVAEAIDTLLVHDVDQVLSTYEDHDLHFRHGRYGLEPLNPGAIRGLRLEREALYAANGAVHVLWRDALRVGSLYEGRVGHIVMSHADSLQAKHPADRARAEAEVRQRRAGEAITGEKPA